MPYATLCPGSKIHCDIEIHAIEVIPMILRQKGDLP